MDFNNQTKDPDLDVTQRCEEDNKVTKTKDKPKSSRSHGARSKSSVQTRSMSKALEHKYLKPKSSSKSSSSHRSSTGTGTSTSSHSTKSRYSEMNVENVVNYHRKLQEICSARAKQDIEDIQASLNTEIQSIQNQTALARANLQEQKRKLEEDLRKKLEEERRKLEEEEQELQRLQNQQCEMIKQRMQQNADETARRVKREHLQNTCELELELTRRGVSTQSSPQLTAAELQPSENRSLAPQTRIVPEQLQQASATIQPTNNVITSIAEASASVAPNVTPSISSNTSYAGVAIPFNSMSHSSRQMSNVVGLSENVCVRERSNSNCVTARLNACIAPKNQSPVIDAKNSRLIVAPPMIDTQITPNLPSSFASGSVQPFVPAYSNQAATAGCAVQTTANYDLNVKPNQPTNLIQCESPYVIHQVKPSDQIVPLKLEPKCFSGDPIEFDTFKEMINATLNRQPWTQKQKLMHLLQYTRGIANTFVKACEDMENCFDEALAVLRDNFGQPFQISDRYINTVINGSKLVEGDNDSLLLFHASLTACTNKLTKFGRIRDVSRSMVEQIAERLPTSWQPGWRT